MCPYTFIYIYVCVCEHPTLAYGPLFVCTPPQSRIVLLHTALLLVFNVHNYQ